MQVIGLTGGIGMGKSTAAEFLSGQGLPVIDTDLIARELTAPGQSVLREISHLFGSRFIDAEGQLQRRALGEHVFRDPDARKQLEALLHPVIRQTWLRRVEQQKDSGAPRVVVVIPLLFETSAQNHFSEVICVACSGLTQRERLLARGWTSVEIEQRVGAQLPAEQKMTAADFVVWTEGALEVHHEQLRRLLRVLEP